MSKEPEQINGDLEVSFDQSQIVICITSINGASLTWDHVESVVKELRVDFEEGQVDGEVH